MITKKDLQITTNELMGDTIKSNHTQIRILNNVAGSSVLGIIMEETEDSFLVAAPSRLVSYNKDSSLDLQIEPYVPVPFARFFKSTLLSVTPAFREFEVAYIDYILKNYDTLFEGIFPPEERENLEKRWAQVVGKPSKEVKPEVKTIKEELPSENSFLVLTDSKYKH